MLRPAARQSGGQRVYTHTDIDRLTFIRRCRDFGFSIEQVEQLVAITTDPASSCMAARDLAAEHLDAVRAKLRELKALERSLVGFVEACNTSCAGGPGPDGVILDDLGVRLRRAFGIAAWSLISWRSQPRPSSKSRAASRSGCGSGER